MAGAAVAPDERSVRSPFFMFAMSKPPCIALLVSLLAACGGQDAVAPPPATPPSPPPPVGAPPPPQDPAAATSQLRPEAGHNLAMLAAGCWFGGIWGDAEGDTPDSRAQASEARCHDVVRRVYTSDDKDRYVQLRALEPSVVGDVAAKVETLAKEDPDDAPRSKVLASLVQAVAAAQREAMVARRAASRVKRDLDHEPDRLSQDEAAAVGALQDSKNLEALLKMDAGDITHDAHALGVLAALERMDISRDLPKHLKIYAVGNPNRILFGLQPPAVPTDATGKLPRGAWLAYISDVAKAAGHAVPDTVKLPKQREPLAWGGALEGYADKLRGDVDQLAKDTRLHHVSEVVIQRLDAEYKAQVNALTGPAAQSLPKAPKSRSAAPVPKKAP